MLDWSSLLTFVAAVVAGWVAYKAWGVLGPLVRANAILNLQPNIPVTDMANVMKRRDLHRVTVEDSERLGSLYRMKLGFLNVLVTSDPWIIAELQDRNKYSDLVDKPEEPFLYPVLNQGCSQPPRPNAVTAPTADPIWKMVHKATAICFNAKNIKSGFTEVGLIAGRLVRTIWDKGSGAVVDMDSAMQCETYDVIGKLGFEIDFGATADLDGLGAKGAALITKTAGLGMARTRSPLKKVPLMSQDARDWVVFRPRLLAMMKQLLEDMLTRPTPDDSNTAIWAQLMRLWGSKGHQMDKPRLWSELSMMFFAGMETTGHTMSWALFEVSQAPEVERKLMEELDAAGLLVTAARPNPRDLEYADLAKLPYLAAVMKEAMRVYTAVPLVYRKAMVDLQLGPYVIPRGTIVVCSLLAMHNSSRNFEDPGDFRPERHLEGKGEFHPLNSAESAAAHAKMAPARLFESLPSDCKPVSRPLPVDEKIKKFAPFGDGPRACIGLPMGIMGYMAAMTRLWSSFHFELAASMGGREGVRESEEYRVAVVPVNGIHMHCHHRPCVF